MTQPNVPVDGATPSTEKPLMALIKQSGIAIGIAGAMTLGSLMSAFNQNEKDTMRVRSAVNITATDSLKTDFIKEIQPR